MTQPLRLVNPETGEITEGCPACRRMEDEISGLQRDIRGWAARYRELERDRDREARENPLWPRAVRLHQFWKLATGHPRSGFDREAFEMAVPVLKKEDDEMCHRAILGLAYDPFVTTRKNGTRKRHDGWHLAFKSRTHFEECCNKAPADWRERRARLLEEMP